MCEPEQGVYLDKEEEDVDIRFADKLMSKEKSSYQYKEENEDVDEKSIKDRKDCYAKNCQHGMMKVKASIETKEPYVFIQMICV